MSERGRRERRIGEEEGRERNGQNEGAAAHHAKNFRASSVTSRAGALIRYRITHAVQTKHTTLEPYMRLPRHRLSVTAAGQSAAGAESHTGGWPHRTRPDKTRQDRHGIIAVYQTRVTYGPCLVTGWSSFQMGVKVGGLWR